MRYRVSRLVFAPLCVFALLFSVAVAAADPGEVDPGVAPPAPPTIQPPPGSFLFATPNGWTLDTNPPQAPVSAVLLGPVSSMRLIMVVEAPLASPDAQINAVKPAISGLADGGLTNEAMQDGTMGPEPARIYTFAGTRKNGSSVSGQIAVAFHGGYMYTFIALADAPALPNAADVTAVLTSVIFA